MQVNWDENYLTKGRASQLTFACLKSLIETPEKGVKYVQS